MTSFPPNCHTANMTKMPTLTENEVSLLETDEDDDTSSNERKSVIFNITPLDGARCKVLIETSDDALSLDIPIGEEFELILGEGQNEIEEKIENALCGLRKGGSKEIFIHFGCTNETSSGNNSGERPKDDNHEEGLIDKNPESSTKIKVLLIDFQNPANVCDYTHKEKLEFARYHKSKGVELFKIGKRRFAYKRFSKALKFLLLMLPRKEIPTALHEEFDLLRTQCYSNMAACLLKESEYDSVIKNCSKALEIDSKNIKSIYRRAEAYFCLHRYKECKLDVDIGLKLEPKSGVFRQLSRRLTSK